MADGTCSLSLIRRAHDSAILACAGFTSHRLAARWPRCGGSWMTVPVCFLSCGTPTFRIVQSRIPSCTSMPSSGSRTSDRQHRSSSLGNSGTARPKPHACGFTLCPRSCRPTWSRDGSRGCIVNRLVRIAGSGAASHSRASPRQWLTNGAR